LDQGSARQLADLLTGGAGLPLTGRDTNVGSMDPEANFGPWTDGTPKTVIAMLQAWIAEHPSTPTQPTNPTGPGTPVDQIAAFVHASQHLYQQFVDAVAAAISNWPASFSAPAATTDAVPLVVKAASVVVLTDFEHSGRHCGATPSPVCH
jgi:hypothetical protein